MVFGILFGLGFFLIVYFSSLMMLWLSVGVLVGLVDGVGYLLILLNCVKWFLECKGLIFVFFIGFYGFGSLGFKFIDFYLLVIVGLEKIFVIWGVIVLVMIVFGVILMKDVLNYLVVIVVNGVVENDFIFVELMCKLQYWMLVVMFLMVCMSGLYVIGVVKDIVQGMVYLDVVMVVNVVMVILIVNFSGCLVLGILFDKIFCICVIIIGQVVLLVGMVVLLFVLLNVLIFFVVIVCVVFNFGGIIIVFLLLVSEFFGLNNLVKNYGVIYLGFGIGSICGFFIVLLFGGFYVIFCVIFVLLIFLLVLFIIICQLKSMVYNEVYV